MLYEVITGTLGLLEPTDVRFVVGKGSDEGFLRHLGQFDAAFHDDALLDSYAIHHVTHAADQAIELLGHQTELA